MSSRRVPLTPVLLTGALVAARVFRAPVLTDPAGGTLPVGTRLHFPLLNIILAPLFDLWDGVSMLSMGRLTGFLTGVVLLWLLWRVVAAVLRHRREPDAGPPFPLLREVSIAIAGLILLVLFIGVGIIWHRPMAALEIGDPDLMRVDTHSHSNASHDVKKWPVSGFSTEANRRWHRRAGFDAFFLTDHNTVANLPPRPPPAGVRPVLCPGTEVSAWHAHIVLLGDTVQVPRSPYSDSLGGLLELLRQSEARYGAITIASLPEYSESQWENLSLLIGAGLDGLELVNAAPKARLAPGRRDTVLSLARTHHLLVVGASDNHGWGATSMVWNLVRIPGWRDVPDPCVALLARLRSGGTGAVQIVERHHLTEWSAWPRWLTPVGMMWETWRSLDPARTTSWLLWIWVGTLLAAGLPEGRLSRPRRRAESPPARAAHREP